MRRPPEVRDTGPDHTRQGSGWKPGALAAVALLIVLASNGFPRQSAERILDGINPAAVYEYVRHLASKEFNGRLTGSPGYKAAAEWVAGLFRTWGMDGIADTGHLQSFPTEYTDVEFAEMSVFPAAPGGTAGQETRLEAGKGFLPLLFSDTGDHTSEAVFVGWGISAPELGYDDYGGIEVRGRFALCFRGTPDPADARFTEYDEHRTRMRTAHDKGALGVIYIYDEPIANPNGAWIPEFTPAVISNGTADLIFKARGVQAATLRGDLLKYRRPLSFATGTRIHYAVRSTHTADGSGWNMVGMVPGADAALRHEYIVVGAHADHCGRLMNLLFPGANDNASGTAVVLEIAHTLASADPRPRRSVVFALFGGEESGLKGSQFFASHLPTAMGKPVAMLNFDMVGEGDAIGCGYSEVLKTVVEQIGAQLPALRSKSAIRRIGVQSSDFAPFFERGIPCLSFSSNGPHLSYHQTGDTIYRINPDILADAARIGLLATITLANR